MPAASLVARSSRPDLQTYRAAADTLFPVRGAWAYDAWSAINRRFWGDTLAPGPILWGLTAGCTFGGYNSNNNAITLHEALPGRAFAETARQSGTVDWVMAHRDQPLNSWGLPPDYFGVGIALGVLLHEAMHQSHHQRDLAYPQGRKRFTVQAHHNTIWVTECERIAAMIGLPQQIWPVYIERKESTAELLKRLDAAGNGLTAKQLNDRRQWIWVPTVDGEEIEVDNDTWQGQQVARTEEITGFPRLSYDRYRIGLEQRVALILGK